MRYKRFASERVFGGSHLTVRRDTWRAPSGQTHDFEVVETPDAVVIVSIDGAGNVLLVLQHRAGPDRVLLELPAGGIDAGETPEQGAQRELREETGHAAARLRLLGNFWTVPGFGTEHMYAFLATDLCEDPLPPDKDEGLTLERMPFAKAMAAARAGQIPDAKSIVALLLAEPVVAELYSFNSD